MLKVGRVPPGLRPATSALGPGTYALGPSLFFHGLQYCIIISEGPYEYFKDAYSVWRNKVNRSMHIYIA